MYSLKAEEGSFMIIATIVVKFKLLFALSNISKGGHSPMPILFQQLLYSVQLIIFLDYLGEVS